MTDEKEIKIEFAPGCFDSFEGTQEELNELMAEIQNMFANKSKQEIEFMGRELTEEDFNELPEELQEQIAQGHLSLSDESEKTKRNLQ